MRNLESIRIVGMGALGMMYGRLFADALGMDAVGFVMDDARYARNLGRSVSCNGSPLEFRLVPAGAAEPADLVVVAVKGPGLAQALETMAGCIGPDTVILSVMNGISSERIIGERYGAGRIVHCVAQGMDAMKIGDVLTYSRTGELRIGVTEEGSRECLEALERLLDRAGMAYVEEKDILYRLWGKFMLNVGVNQTCMVYGTGYGGVLAEGEPNRTMISAMREVMSVARAEGVELTDADLSQYVAIVGTLNPESTPSMGQDRISRRKSEVELFAGTVVSLAAKHGILVPVNAFLYKRVMEIEAEY
ncbi:MAG: 2-dehydropantoate 2-reductase [Mailhella sp.]|nr:2-dehydropantoate 2-reductase [Mailhella sp.]